MQNCRCPPLVDRSRYCCRPVEPIQCARRPVADCVDRSTLVQSTSPTGRDIPVDRSTFGQNRKRSCRRLVEEHADRSPISRASVDQSSTPPSTGRPREKNVSSPSDVTKSSYASEASMAHCSYYKACSLGNLGLRPSYAKDSKVLLPFLQRIQRGYL